MKLGGLKFLSLSLFILFLAFSLTSFSEVSAQAEPSTTIIANIVPSNPAPFEEVSISLTSYADNLDSVLITWRVNGQNMSSGIGKKSFSLRAGGAGTETTVTATVALPAKAQEVRMVVRPSVMVLLWQANDSYVPPFYKGKALPSADSEIKVVAMPEIRSGGSIVSPKNMTYSWRRDYSNDVGNSGYGKNSYLFVNDYLEDSANVSVVASTIDQKYSSEASLDMSISEPKIVFYRSDNNLGTIWDHALPNTHQINESEVVVAIPYFISPKEIQNPRLVWSWSINDRSVSILGFKKNVMPLQAEEGTSGMSKLKLQIDNKDRIFQSATKEMFIQF